MQGVLLAAVLIVIVLLAVNLVWRWASRRRSLPCPTWLSFAVRGGGWMDALMQTEATVAALALRTGESVLELGPGPGRLLLRAARQVGPEGLAVGLDIQRGMVERLRTRAQREGVVNVETLVGDASRTALASGQFDVVYLSTVLGEVPDREAALAECFRLLRPGGRLSVTEIVGDPHYQRAATVRQLAQQAGFTAESKNGTWWRTTSNFRKPA